MMYKIVNNLAPPYLSELRPDNVSSRSNRSLRANDNLIVPFARTERYKKSFYISSVNLWNSLSATIRSSRSIAIFKNSVTRLHKCVVPNTLYYIGDRLPAILHTRLRLSNSTLNYDLYLKNCVSSSFCACGFPKKLQLISFSTVTDMLLFGILCSPLLFPYSVKRGQVLVRVHVLSGYFVVSGMLLLIRILIYS